MKVLVTGGSGKLGHYAILDLLAHNHQVLNADRARPRHPDLDEVRFIETDLTNVGHVAGALKGCDAVLHLGAIPVPYGHPDEVVFANNTGATFAVLQAASLLGVTTAAIASSCSAYGTAYAPIPLKPVYAPLDEAHPLLNHDCYGLSKEVDERTAEMFHRRAGMQIAALRFHWVVTPEEQAAFPRDGMPDPDEYSHLLWGYIDARDAGAACRMAIEANGFGFEPFNIVAADTLMTRPTEPLIEEYLPDTDLRAPIAGTASGFSTEKAERLLGWRPRHSWREQGAGA